MTLDQDMVNMEQSVFVEFLSCNGGAKWKKTGSGTKTK